MRARRTRLSSSGLDLWTTTATLVICVLSLGADGQLSPNDIVYNVPFPYLCPGFKGEFNIETGLSPVKCYVYIHSVLYESGGKGGGGERVEEETNG